MAGTKSPLRAKPRRVPGQSVDEHLHERLIDDLLFPFIVAAMMIGIAFFEWVRFIRPSPPNPWLATAIAVGGLCYAVVKIHRNVPRLKALKMGRDGERAVAEVLEALRESGYQVFHDVLGDGFNVDHVLIGPTGVYSVETKTYSKPMRGEAVVTFDGDRVLVGQHEPDQNAITQGRAQAGWLRQLLKESTGLDVGVRPVVLYPGWYVNKSSSKTADIWVLNPKALPSFLSNHSPVLRRDEIKLLSFHLSRYVRASQ